MSKSKGTLFPPDDLTEKLRRWHCLPFFSLFFCSPTINQLEWSDSGVEGAFKFLNAFKISADENST
jgi:leucyl-tRNA synthetase